MDPNSKEFRTRFAPSPTGYVHIGSLRTTLFEYLAAKANGGKIILRIEDTDQERFVEGALENMLEVFHYLGIDFDEGPQLDGTEKGEYGPYVQTKRKDLHLKYAQELVNKGHAYYCFCSKERLDDLRNKQRERKQAPMYDRHCLNMPESEIKARLEAGEPYVIRQKIPYEVIKFKDLIYGNIQFHGKTIDDQVLIKSDGLPTYHLANVIDDHTMNISHVIRGEEWLPSTPKHVALYKAFGWQMPHFAHVPLILNKDKTKLSKRQGDVAVEDYIKKGYTKEAMINFMALLGWNPGAGEKQEIFSLKELEKIFTIEKINKSGAIFDLEKLNWFDWQWKKILFNNEMERVAKNLDPKVETNIDKRKNKTFKFSNKSLENEFINMRGDYLLSKTQEYLDQTLVENEKEKLKKALITVEEKIHKNEKDTQEHIDFYFSLPKYQKELYIHEKMKVDLKIAKTSLENALESIKSLNTWTIEEIKTTLIDTVEKLGIKNGQLLWPIRVALSGLEFSPGVFEAMWVLEKEETLNRIQLGIEKLT